MEVCISPIYGEGRFYVADFLMFSGWYSRWPRVRRGYQRAEGRPEY